MEGYHGVNDRIILIRLNTRPVKINLIRVHDLSADAKSEELRDFHGLLTSMPGLLLRHEVIVILGDFNKKIGSSKKDYHIREIVGNFGIGERNDIIDDNQLNFLKTLKNASYMVLTK